MKDDFYVDVEIKRIKQIKEKFRIKSLCNCSSMKEKEIPDFWVDQQVRCQWCFLRKAILNENKKDEELH